MEVQLDLTAAQGNSALSHAERSLAVIEAALEGRLPGGMETYQIAGQAVSKMKIKELMELRGHMAGLVSSKEAIEAIATAERFVRAILEILKP